MPRTEERARRARGDRGATLVEAALMTPVFLLVVFAIFEFGLAFRHYLTVSNTAASAARTASTAGDEIFADHAILQEVAQASSAIPRSELEAVVVFDAGAVDGSVEDETSPLAACRTTSVTGLCNRYTAADLDLHEEDFGCEVGSPDRFWCPLTRETSLSGPPDHIGVFVEIDYDFVTGFFGSSRTFTDETVIRIEPREP